MHKLQKEERENSPNSHFTILLGILNNYHSYVNQSSVSNSSDIMWYIQKEFWYMPKTLFKFSKFMYHIWSYDR